MLQGNIHKNFLLHLRVDCIVYIKTNGIFRILKKLFRKMLFRISDTVQNVHFLYRLFGDSGGLVVHAAKLCCSITAERVDCPLGQKQLPVVQQQLSRLGEIQVVLRLQPQNLNGIGITLFQQVYQLRKRIDRGIRGNISHLLKTFAAKDLRLAQCGTAPNVQIRSFRICAVGVRTAQPQQHHTTAQVGIGPQEIIRFSVQCFSNFM